MNYRGYYSMFKNEPDVLTVPDVIRLLRIGRNSVYKLIKEGKIGSIKQGKKIIIPKTCLIKFLLDKNNYQVLSPLVTNNHWTGKRKCDSIYLTRENSKKNP